MAHETISVIKSCIASRKGGVPLTDIDEEYQEFTGERIPFHKMGFETLVSFLYSIPNIRIHHSKGGIPVLMVQDEKISHLTALVQNQKSTQKGKENSYTGEHILRKQRNTNSPNRRPNSRRGRDCSRDYRTARMVDNTLKITVCPNTSSNIEICYSSDEDGGSTVNTSSSLMASTGAKGLTRFSLPCLDVEPSLCHHQMIGDDFFLHLAISLGSRMPHKNGELGLCVSGQRIRNCLTSVRNAKILSYKVVLLIGAIDILEGRDIDSMKAYMQDLIEILTKRAKSVVIVTIPPLVNIYHLRNKWSTLIMFNTWLKQFVTGYGCQIVDIWPALKGERMYNFYEVEPRRIVRSPSYIMLWNHLGTKRVIDFLQTTLLV